MEEEKVSLIEAFITIKTQNELKKNQDLNNKEMKIDYEKF